MGALALALALTLSAQCERHEGALRACKAGVETCQVRLEELRAVDRTITSTVMVQLTAPAPVASAEPSGISPLLGAVILTGAVLLSMGTGYAFGRLLP